MSIYSSVQTGNAPGGFNISHPDRFLDVAYSSFNSDDIRLTVQTSGRKTRTHINTLEARELATRLLIAIGTPQHLITELIQLQEDAGAAKETHW